MLTVIYILCTLVSYYLELRIKYNDLTNILARIHNIESYKKPSILHAPELWYRQ